MPQSKRFAVALAVAGVLAVASAPAHAVSVNAPLPQTPVPVPEAEVTAPGTNVTVGPGGANVDVDPGRAVGEVTGAKPGQSAPEGSSGTKAPQSEGQGTSPSGSADIAHGVREPGERSEGGGPRGESPAGGSRSREGGTADGRAAGEGGSAAARGAASGAAPELGGARNAAAAEAPKSNLIAQVFEKVRTELLAALIALATLAAAMSLVWLRERTRVRKMRRRAEVDPLTGIPNRLAFEQRLAEEFRRARRYDRPLGVLLLDLDGLKRVNDTAGHEAGDRLIRSAAARIASNVRASDLGARLAGDEFVVLCPETRADGLEQVGRKFVAQLGDAGIEASVGWAELRQSDASPEELLARADAAMYQEKARRKHGRSEPTARPDLAIAG